MDVSEQTLARWEKAGIRLFLALFDVLPVSCETAGHGLTCQKSFPPSRKSVGTGLVSVGKLSISIPDALEAQLDERAEAEGVSVSRMVAEALKAYFALPPVPTPPPPPELAEQLRQVQAYLWDLHFSHECTRAASLNLYYWAQRSGENMGMPPEQEMEKPPWPKPGD